MENSLISMDLSETRHLDIIKVKFIRGHLIMLCGPLTLQNSIELYIGQLSQNLFYPTTTIKMSLYSSYQPTNTSISMLASSGIDNFTYLANGNCRFLDGVKLLN